MKIWKIIILIFILCVCTSSFSAYVNINNDADYTTSRSVTLYLSWNATFSSNPANYVTISNNNSDWDTKTYSATISWIISNIQGENTVYVKFYNVHDTWLNTDFDAITYDNAAPTINSFIINNDSEWVNNTSVTLTINASDVTATVDNMMISSSSNFAGASWESYFTSKSWTISSGDGTKTVYIKVKDSAGNISNVDSDTIRLYNISPKITRNQKTYPIETGDSWYVTDPGNIIDIDFYKNNDGPNLLKAEYSLDNINWSNIFSNICTSYDTNWSVNFSNLLQGDNTVYIRLFDVINNMYDTQICIKKDTEKPEISNYMVHLIDYREIRLIEPGDVGTIEFTWNDLSSTITYSIYNDTDTNHTKGQLFDTMITNLSSQPNNWSTQTNLLVDDTVTFWLHAVDEVGNSVDTWITITLVFKEEISDTYSWPLEIKSSPDDAAYLSGVFGELRGTNRFHSGIDISRRPSGSISIKEEEIYVTRKGYMYSQDPYWGQIIVRHGYDTDAQRTGYIHMKDNSYTYKEGKLLKRNEKIGNVWSTGLGNESYHLHYEIQSDTYYGAAVIKHNPLNFELQQKIDTALLDNKVPYIGSYDYYNSLNTKIPSAITITDFTSLNTENEDVDKKIDLKITSSLSDNPRTYDYFIDTEVVNVWGKKRILLKAKDRGRTVGMGLYGISMEIDSSLMYNLEFNQMDNFDSKNVQPILHDYGDTTQNSKYLIYKLYDAPGRLSANTHFYDPAYMKSYYDFSTMGRDTHTLRIVVSDISGHSAEVTIPFTTRLLTDVEYDYVYNSSSFDTEVKVSWRLTEDVSFLKFQALLIGDTEYWLVYESWEATYEGDNDETWKFINNEEVDYFHGAKINGDYLIRLTATDSNGDTDVVVLGPVTYFDSMGINISKINDSGGLGRFFSSETVPYSRDFSIANHLYTVIKTISGNGNQAIEAGEYLSLITYLTNNTQKGFYPIGTLYLLPDNISHPAYNYIDFVDGYNYSVDTYSFLYPGESDTGNSGFGLKLKPDMPKGTPLDMSVIISDVYDWTRRYFTSVTGMKSGVDIGLSPLYNPPLIKDETYGNTNGIVTAGELLDLKIDVVNRGYSYADNVKLMINADTGSNNIKRMFSNTHNIIGDLGSKSNVDGYTNREFNIKPYPITVLTKSNSFNDTICFNVILNYTNTDYNNNQYSDTFKGLITVYISETDVIPPRISPDTMPEISFSGNQKNDIFKDGCNINITSYLIDGSDNISGTATITGDDSVTYTPILTGSATTWSEYYEQWQYDGEISNTLPDGEYTCPTIIFDDNYGNTVTSPSHGATDFKLDNYAPILKFIKLEEVTSDTVYFKGIIYDYYLDSAFFRYRSIDTDTLFSIVTDTSVSPEIGQISKLYNKTDIPEAKYYGYMEAYDKVGHYSASDTFIFVVDFKRPTISEQDISIYPFFLKRNEIDTVAISFTAVENVSDTITANVKITNTNNGEILKNISKTIVMNRENNEIVPTPVSIYWDLTDNSGNLIYDNFYYEVEVTLIDNSFNQSSFAGHAIKGQLPQDIPFEDRTDTIYLKNIEQGDILSDTFTIVGTAYFHEPFEFGSLVIEYAPVNYPDSFILIAESFDTEIINEAICDWHTNVVPDGEYILRLIATNSMTDSTISTQLNVFVSNPFDVELVLSSESFSPDGDGIQDEMILNYRVTKPVSGGIIKIKESGVVVDSYVISSSILAGEEYTLNWSGAGFSEGDYRVEFEGVNLYNTSDIKSTSADFHLNRSVITGDTDVAISSGLDTQPGYAYYRYAVSGTGVVNQGYSLVPIGTGSASIPVPKTFTSTVRGAERVSQSYGLENIVLGGVGFIRKRINVKIKGYYKYKAPKNLKANIRSSEFKSLWLVPRYWTRPYEHPTSTDNIRYDYNVSLVNTSDDNNAWISWSRWKEGSKANDASIEVRAWAAGHDWPWSDKNEADYRYTIREYSRDEGDTVKYIWPVSYFNIESTNAIYDSHRIIDENYFEIYGHVYELFDIFGMFHSYWPCRAENASFNITTKGMVWDNTDPKSKVSFPIIGDTISGIINHTDKPKKILFNALSYLKIKEQNPNVLSNHDTFHAWDRVKVIPAAGCTIAEHTEPFIRNVVSEFTNGDTKYYIVLDNRNDTDIYIFPEEGYTDTISFNTKQDIPYDEKEIDIKNIVEIPDTVVQTEWKVKESFELGVLSDELRINNDDIYLKDENDIENEITLFDTDFIYVEVSDNNKFRVKLDTHTYSNWKGKRFVPVKGSINIQDLDIYTVYYGKGSNPLKWHVIYKGDNTIENNVVAYWDVTYKIGEYSLLLKAEDKSGNIYQSDKISINIGDDIENLSEEDWAYSPYNELQLGFEENNGLCAINYLDTKIIELNNKQFYINRPLFDFRKENLLIDAELPVKVVYYYTDEQLAAINTNADSVMIYYYNKEKQKVAPINNFAHDSDKKFWSGEIHHFSKFAFIEDTVAPSIFVYRLKQDSAYYSVKPVFEFDDDIGVDTTTIDIRINNVPYNPSEVITSEGEKILSIKVRDYQGNLGQKVMRFSIDRHSPTISGMNFEKRYDSDVIPAVYQVGMSDRFSGVDWNRSDLWVISPSGRVYRGTKDVGMIASLGHLRNVSGFEMVLSETQVTEIEQSQESGTYKLAVLLVDKIGNVDYKVVDVNFVDNTPPFVSIISPDSFYLHSGLLERSLSIIGTVNDQFLSSYELKIGRLDFSTTAAQSVDFRLETINVNYVNVETGVLGVWNSKESFELGVLSSKLKVRESGFYLVELMATDLGGNVSVDTVIIRLDNDEPVISGVPDEKIVISPNGDGRLDSIEEEVLVSDLGSSEFLVLSDEFETAYLTAGSSEFLVLNSEFETAYLTVVRQVRDGMNNVIDSSSELLVLNSELEDTGSEGLWKMVDLEWSGLDESGVAYPDGYYKYLINVFDEAGNQSAASFEIDLDLTACEISMLSDNPRFSPNSDNVKDTTAFYFNLSEPAVVDIEICDAVYNKVWADTDLEFGQGLNHFDWNGYQRLIDLSELPGAHSLPDTVVKDGRYEVKIIATDKAGLVSVNYGYVTVDTRKPDISNVFDYMDPISHQISQTWWLNYTVTDDFGLLTPGNVKVTAGIYHLGDDPDIDTPIYVLEDEFNDGCVKTYFNSWNIFSDPAKDGYYAYFLTASDEAGNVQRLKDLKIQRLKDLKIQRLEDLNIEILKDLKIERLEIEKMGTFLIDNTGAVLSDCSFSDSVVMGNTERVAFRYYIYDKYSDNFTTVIDIKNPNHQVIKTLEFNDNPGTGYNTWDLTDNTGRKLDVDGVYFFTITTYDEAINSSNSFFDSFILDSKPPAIRSFGAVPYPFITNASGFTEGCTLTFSVQEEVSFPVDISVEVVNSYDSVVWEDNIPPQNTSYQLYKVHWTGDGMDGKYKFVVNVHDGLGNNSIRTVPAMKNQIKSAITFPTADTEVCDTVIIKGTALVPYTFGNNTDFMYYKLFCVESELIDPAIIKDDIESVAEAIPIPVPIFNQNINDNNFPFSNVSYRPVENSILGIWDTKRLVDGGDYYIVVCSYDSAGHKSAAYKKVHVTQSMDYDTPELTCSLNYTTFSPDITDDNPNDILRIDYTLSGESADIFMQIFKVDTTGSVTAYIKSKQWSHNPGTYFYDWNGNDFQNLIVDEGQYMIWLEAMSSDGIGYARDIKTVYVETTNYPLEITHLSVAPYPFSPNGDGIADTCTIHYCVSEQAKVDVVVYDTSNNIIKVLQQHRTENILSNPVWDYYVNWNGTEQNYSRIVPSGKYTVRVIASAIDVNDPTNNSDVVLSDTIEVVLVEEVPKGLTADITEPGEPSGNEDVTIITGDANFDWAAKGTGTEYPDTNFQYNVKATGTEITYNPVNFDYQMVVNGAETMYIPQEFRYKVKANGYEPAYQAQSYNCEVTAHGKETVYPDIVFNVEYDAFGYMMSYPEVNFTYKITAIGQETYFSHYNYSPIEHSINRVSVDDGVDTTLLYNIYPKFPYQNYKAFGNDYGEFVPTEATYLAGTGDNHLAWKIYWPLESVGTVELIFVKVFSDHYQFKFSYSCPDIYLYYCHPTIKCSFRRPIYVSDTVSTSRLNSKTGLNYKNGWVYLEKADFFPSPAHGGTVSSVVYTLQEQIRDTYGGPWIDGNNTGIEMKFMNNWEVFAKVTKINYQPWYMSYKLHNINSRAKDVVEISFCDEIKTVLENPDYLPDTDFLTLYIWNAFRKYGKYEAVNTQINENNFHCWYDTDAGYIYIEVLPVEGQTVVVGDWTDTTVFVSQTVQADGKNIGENIHTGLPKMDPDTHLIDNDPTDGIYYELSYDNTDNIDADLIYNSDAGEWQVRVRTKTAETGKYPQLWGTESVISQVKNVQADSGTLIFDFPVLESGQAVPTSDPYGNNINNYDNNDSVYYELFIYHDTSLLYNPDVIAGITTDNKIVVYTVSGITDRPWADASSIIIGNSATSEPGHIYTPLSVQPESVLPMTDPTGSVVSCTFLLYYPGTDNFINDIVIVYHNNKYQATTVTEAGKVSNPNWYVVSDTIYGTLNGYPDGSGDYNTVIPANLYPSNFNNIVDMQYHIINLDNANVDLVFHKTNDVVTNSPSDMIIGTTDYSVPWTNTYYGYDVPFNETEFDPDMTLDPIIITNSIPENVQIESEDGWTITLYYHAGETNTALVVYEKIVDPANNNNDRFIVKLAPKAVPKSYYEIKGVASDSYKLSYYNGDNQRWQLITESDNGANGTLGFWDVSRLNGDKYSILLQVTGSEGVKYFKRDVGIGDFVEGGTQRIVYSPYKRAQLNIDENTLASDYNDLITVTPLSKESSNIQFDAGIEPFGPIMELQPHGLPINKEDPPHLTITFTFEELGIQTGNESRIGTLNIYFVNEDGGLELSATTRTVDKNDRIVLLSSPIYHFSKYMVLLRENIPPELDITTPSINGKYSDLISITGTITDDDFKKYIIEYTAGSDIDENTEWTLVYTENNVKTIRYDWNTSLIPTGIYTVRITAIDNNNSKNTKIIPVKIDNTPPVSTIVVSNPKYIDTSGGLWITEMTDIKLSAYDNQGQIISSLDKIFYSIDNGNHRIYSGEFKLTGLSNGVHTIGYYSVDSMGNAESTNFMNVNLSVTKPVVEIMSGSPDYTTQNHIFISDKTPILLSGTDNSGPGISRLEYRIGTAEWREYQTSFYVKYPYDDKIVISARSTNHAGIVSNITRKEVIIDNIPCKTDISFDGIWYSKDSFKSNDGDKVYIRNSTKILLTTADQGSYPSGVNKLTYKLIDSNENVLINQVLNTPGNSMEGLDLRCEVDLSGFGTGEYRLELITEDNVGNVEDKNIFVVIDEEAGKSEIQLLSGNIYVKNNIIISSKHQILKIDSFDSLSGVNHINYSVDNGLYKRYSEPFEITDGNTHTISYFSVDNVGVEESVETMTIFIDNDPPVTHINIGTPKLCLNPVYITKNTSITLQSNETVTDISKIEYKISDGEYKEYTGPFTVVADKSQTIYYRSTDMVNNRETAKSINVYNDNVSPVSILNFTGYNKLFDGKYYINSQTELSVTSVETEGVGAKRSYVKLDGNEISNYVSFTILEDNVYELTFQSDDKLNNIEPLNSVTIVNDNTAPLGVINFPVENDYYRESVEIIGSSSDVNFMKADLWYSRESKPDDWISIGEIQYSEFDQKHICDLDISSFNEIINIKLDAVDHSGNKKSVIIGFIADNIPPEISSVQTSESIYSPLSVPLQIQCTVSEPVRPDIIIADTTGNIIRNISYTEYYSAGTAILSWDGRDDSGNIVPDGIYTINIKVHDRAGNHGVNNIQQNVIFDIIPPVIENISGNVSVATGDDIEIHATIYDNETSIADSKIIITDLDGKVTEIPFTDKYLFNAPIDRVGIVQYKLWAKDIMGNISVKPNMGNYAIKIFDNVPPVAVISGNNEGVEGSTFFYDGTGSYDNATVISEYIWGFDDKNSDINQSNLPKPSHVYADNGNYVVTLKVYDNAENRNVSETTEYNVRVNNAVPVIDNLNVVEGYNPQNTGRTVRFEASASDLGLLDILTYSWDFDYTGNFQADVTGIDLVMTEHIYNQPGEYIVALRVSDNDGGISEIRTTTVRVNREDLIITLNNPTGQYSDTAVLSVQVSEDNSDDIDGVDDSPVLLGSPYEIEIYYQKNHNDILIQKNSIVENAEIVIPIPAAPAGEYLLIVKYNGSNYYNSVIVEKILTILKEDMIIEYNGGTTKQYSDILDLFTVLTESDNMPGDKSAKELRYQVGTQDIVNTSEYSNNRYEVPGEIQILQSAGEKTVRVDFAGDDYYNPSSISLQISVEKENLLINYIGDVSEQYSDFTDLHVQINDEDNSTANISNRKIKYTLGNQDIETYTDNTGSAEVQLKILQSAQRLVLQYNFSGDEYYNPVSGEKDFTINREDAIIIYTGDLTGQYSDAITFQAQFTEPNDDVSVGDKSNKNITYNLGTQSQETKTNSTGIASLQLSKLDQKAGQYQIITNWIGDEYYLPAQDIDTFDLLRENLVLSASLVYDPDTSYLNTIAFSGVTDLEIIDDDGDEVDRYPFELVMYPYLNSPDPVNILYTPHTINQDKVTIAINVGSLMDGKYNMMIEYQQNDYYNDVVLDKSEGMWIDQTPPQIQISYDYHYDTEIILQSGFEIIADDISMPNFSNTAVGVRNRYYRILGKTDWRTWDSIFTLAEYDYGQYTIGYSADDHLNNRSPEKTETVQLIPVLTVENKLSGDLPRMLVWLNTADDTESFLDLVKDRNTLYCNTVNNAESFGNELRSQLYNLYIIFGDKNPITGHIGDALQEDVYKGRNLMLIQNWKITDEGKWDIKEPGGLTGFAKKGIIVGSGNTTDMKLVGVDKDYSINADFKGKIYKIEIGNGASNDEVINPNKGKGKKQNPNNEITTDTSITLKAYFEFDNDTYPAITEHNYGRGKVIYYAFNPFCQTTADSLIPIVKQNMEILEENNDTCVLNRRLIAVENNVFNRVVDNLLLWTESFSDNKIKVVSASEQGQISDYGVLWLTEMKHHETDTHWLVFILPDWDYESPKIKTEYKYNVRGLYYVYTKKELEIPTGIQYTDLILLVKDMFWDIVSDYDIQENKSGWSDMINDIKDPATLTNDELNDMITEITVKLKNFYHTFPHNNTTDLFRWRITDILQAYELEWYVRK